MPEISFFLSFFFFVLLKFESFVYFQLICRHHLYHHRSPIMPRTQHQLPPTTIITTSTIIWNLVSSEIVSWEIFRSHHSSASNPNHAHSVNRCNDVEQFRSWFSAMCPTESSFFIISTFCDVRFSLSKLMTFSCKNETSSTTFKPSMMKTTEDLCRPRYRSLASWSPLIRQQRKKWFWKLMRLNFRS